MKTQLERLIEALKKSAPVRGDIGEVYTTAHCAINRTIGGLECLTKINATEGEIIQEIIHHFEQAAKQ